MPDENYNPDDRRPIAARKWRLAEVLTKELVKREITPNTISVFGMVAALIAGAALALTSSYNPSSIVSSLLFLIAAIGIQLRLLSNMLDGMVAVSSGHASAIGELYNDIPDRISDSAVLIGLGYAYGGSISLGFAAALAAVSTAYVRALGKSLTGSSSYSGIMAKQQRMFLVTALCLYSIFSIPSWCSATTCLYPASALLFIILVGSLYTCTTRTRKIVAKLKATTS